MFKWQNLASQTVHAGEFLEMSTLCGVEVTRRSEGKWAAVESTTKVSCLNCERQIRRLARDGHQYREWMGDDNVWHPRFGPKPRPKADYDVVPAHVVECVRALR